MKAILLRETGSFDKLGYEDVSDPLPGPGQVRIRTHAVSVNFADTQVRRGTYPAALSPRLPAVPGLELSGEVELRGEGVRELAVGQPVAAWVRGGAYAERVVADVVDVFAVPAGVDLDAAAAVLVNYGTAWHILHTVGHLKAGQRVVIAAAAGGVGLAALQLAKKAGASVIGLVSRPEKARFLEAQKIDHAIVTGGEDAVARVQSFTAGKGADLVLESAGGEAFAEAFKMLGPFGRVVWFGAASGPSPADLMTLMRATAGMSPSVTLFNLNTVRLRHELYRESMEGLVGMLARREIAPVIHARVPLADAGRAHQMLESRGTIGKVLLKP